jgi:hypothetical protein
MVRVLARAVPKFDILVYHKTPGVLNFPQHGIYHNSFLGEYQRFRDATFGSCMNWKSQIQIRLSFLDLLSKFAKIYIKKYLGEGLLDTGLLRELY